MKPFLFPLMIGVFAGAVFNAEVQAQSITPEIALRVQNEIRAFVPAINALTRVSLDPNTVFVYDGVAPLDEALLHEWRDRLPNPEVDVEAMSIAVGRDATGRWVDEHQGGFCLILIDDEGLAETGRSWDSLKVHELFHCYQHWVLRDSGGTFGVARWIIEGQAEWASETLVGGSHRSLDLFNDYLSLGSISLFDRTYDAFPFYSHLLARDGNLWSRVLEVIKRRDDAPVFLGLTERTPDLVTWPMGLWRDPTRSAEWMSHVPGNPEPSATFPQITLRAGDVRSVFSVTPYHFVVRPNLNKIVTIRVRDSFGAVYTDSLSGAAVEDRVSGSTFEKSYCIGEEFQCQCPGGGPPVDTFVDLGRDSIDVALTARPGATGQVEVIERDLNCCADSGSVPAEWVGSWELDPEHYLNAVYPPQSFCSTTVSGTQTMQIYSNGMVSRTSSNLTSTQVCREGTPRETRSHQITNGSTRACVRTVQRPPIGYQTWTRLMFDTHQTEYTPPLAPGTVQAFGPGEPPAMRLFVGRWDGVSGGARAYMGSARMEGSDLLIRPADTGPGLPAAPGGRRYRRLVR